MNDRTQQLLTEAKADVARGEQFYQSAADKIIAAMKSDPTLGYGRVGRELGKGETWCRTLVQWRTNPQGTAPFAEEQGKVAKRHADSVARNDPPALVESIEKAPPEQRREIIERIYQSSELEADVGHAAAKATRDTRDTDDQRSKDSNPSGYRLRNQVDAQAEIARMDHAGLKALKFLQEVDDGEIEELDRELFLWRLRRVAATCDWMIARLTTGARSVDDELAELLGEEV